MDIQELNPAQLQAVQCCDAPSLVIAGAGAGKTRVLTYKIAWLIEHEKMQPWNILALTFTNKAAREMQERISRQVGEEKASQLWMGTFHSIFSRILRIESGSMGFTSDFTIYDATDSKNLVKAIIREMGLSDKQYKPSTVCAHISNAKNALVLPAAYRMNASLIRRDAISGMEKVADIYERYWQRCRQAGVMDFDDLLLCTWMLFRDHPEVAGKYQERFQFVLVDEYQDTNYAQHQIIWQLTAQRQRVCVVGDDAQSIYSFRGANIDNILNFRQMYRDAKLFKLEQNYRSSQNIVGAANSLISHNERQIHKEVFSQNEVGTRVEVCQAYSDTDEANVIVRKIHYFAKNYHLKYGQQAILYRTNAQSRSLEEALRREGIPYRIYGGMSFYQRKEVKDLIAYFRMAVNPSDEEAMRRIINYPARGIGQTTVNKIMDVVSARGLSVWDVLTDPESLGVNKGTQEKLRLFCQMIEGFHAVVATEDAYTLAMRIVRESGVQADIFHGKDPDDQSRQENLQELLDGVSTFVQVKTEEGQGTLLTHYLQEVSLLSDVDEDNSVGDDKVTLMTVHSAKGLEFDAVMVSGMEENLFPSQMSMENPRQIEEERRLFYVAMTRARHHLVITYAKSRMRYGRMEFGTPSRFIHEIDPKYLSVGKGAQSQASGGGLNPFSSQSSSRFSRGFDVPPSRPSEPFSNRRTEGTSRPFGTPPSSFPPSRLKRLQGTPSQTSPAVTRKALTAAGLQNAPQPVSPGTVIAHERFGRGVVERVEGTGMDTKATVRFDNAGVKQLLLRFAKFTIVS